MRKYITMGTVVFGVVFGLPAHAETCAPAFVHQMQNIDNAMRFCTTEECRLEAAGLKSEVRGMCERVLKHNQHPTKIGYSSILTDMDVLAKKAIDWGKRNNLFAPEKAVDFPGQK